MFAILFDVLLIEFKRKSFILLVGRGGGVKGRKNCEQKFCEQTGVSYKIRLQHRNSRVCKPVVSKPWFEIAG